MPVWLGLVMVYVLWGATYLAMRVSVAVLPPWGMAGTRFVLAGVVALLVVRARGGAFPTRRDWIRALPGGLLFFVIGNGFIAIAEQSIDSSVAAAVAASTPLFASAIGAARGERPSRGELLGMILGMTGVALLAGSTAITGAGLRGLVLLVAPIGFAGGSVLVRSGRAAPAGAQMVAGGVMMLLLSLASRERMPAHVSAGVLGAWLYLVIGGSVIGFTVYAWLLRNARQATAMSYAYVNPLIAVILGAAFGGERLSSTTAAAAALITLGVVCAITLRGTAPAAAVAVK